MHSLDDTIVAVASPPGGAARGIVRLSGPGLRDCLERCFRPDPFVPLTSIQRPTVVPGFVFLHGFASPAPCDLYLWPGRRSYTGQPVAEIHTIGSLPLLEAVMRAACSGGARPASPGEFTLRAFLAGRIDLTQAEAVLGVIDATESAELDAALVQLAGGLAEPLRQLRSALLDVLAHLEAGFDFADEDLPFITSGELLRQIDDSAKQVRRLLDKMAFRSEAVESVRVVLIGRPNAGKSSLFNALLQRSGAIVSAQPGTTRDYLTAELEIEGLKCQLIDTAGMEAIVADLDDASIAAAAQSMTQAQSRRADVTVLCLEAGRPLDDWEREQLARFDTPNRIVVQTKVDLRSSHFPVGEGRGEGILLPASILPTSSHTGHGLHQLKEAICTVAHATAGPPTAVVAGTAVRCSESLRLAAASLDLARDAITSGLGEELIAAEVRVALIELGKVAGTVYTNDLLDRIFSRFCIGK